MSTKFKLQKVLCVILFFQDGEGQAVRGPVPHPVRGAVRRQGRGGGHDQEPRRGRRRHTRGALQEYLDVRKDGKVEMLSDSEYEYGSIFPPNLKNRFTVTN